MYHGIYSARRVKLDGTDHCDKRQGPDRVLVRLEEDRGCGLESGLGFKTHRVLLGDEEVWEVGSGSGMRDTRKLGGWSTSSWDPMWEEMELPIPDCPQQLGSHVFMLKMERVGMHCSGSLGIPRELGLLCP